MLSLKGWKTPKKMNEPTFLKQPYYVSPKLILVYMNNKDVEWHCSNYGLLFYYDFSYFT